MRPPQYATIVAMSLFFAPRPQSALAQCGMEELPKLIPADWASGDAFGGVIAVDGDRVVIGAAGVDGPAGSNCGAAYVFFWNGSAWQEEAKLVAADPADGNSFGSVVAISGDRIAVGAYNDDDGGANAGAVYVYLRQGAVWTQEAKLTASDAQPGDVFGSGVGLLGEWLIVGAPSHDYPGFPNVGTAYVFRFDGASWVERQKLGPDPDGSIYWDAQPPAFGFAVSMDGERAAITALVEICGWANNTAVSCAGSLYYFRRAGDTWIREDRASEFDMACVPVYMGRSSELDGQRLIAADSECMKVYRRVGLDWQFEQNLVPPPLAQGGGSAFFHNVSISGNAAVVGLPNADPNGASNAGNAFLYRHDGTQWVLTETFGEPDATANDNHGKSAAVSGDRLLIGSAARLTAGGPTVDVVHAYALVADCNANSLDDACDVAGATSLDCNTDGIPDECQLGPNDCNANSVPDDCDIAAGTSQDVDENGFPDECCTLVEAPLAEPNGVLRNRYISLVPQNVGYRTALRVNLTSLNHPDPPGGAAPADYSAFEGERRWLGPPEDFFTGGPNTAQFRAARLQCTPYYTDWGDVGLVHVYGDAIVPSSYYDVEAVFEACVPGDWNFSNQLACFTGWWGDVAPPFQPTCEQSLCSPGSCTRERCATQPNALDIASLVDAYKGLPGAISKLSAQLQPHSANPGGALSALDVTSAVNAFKGFVYAYSGPTPCAP